MGDLTAQSASFWLHRSYADAVAELTAAAKAYQADPQFMKDRISVHNMVSAAKNEKRRRDSMAALKLPEGGGEPRVSGNGEERQQPAPAPVAAKPPPPGIRPDQPYPLDKIHILARTRPLPPTQLPRRPAPTLPRSEASS